MIKRKNPPPAASQKPSAAKKFTAIKSKLDFLNGNLRLFPFVPGNLQPPSLTNGELRRNGGPQETKAKSSKFAIAFNVLSWSRSSRSLQFCRDSCFQVENDTCRPNDHCTTLESLYAEEQRLYKEVKVLANEVNIGYAEMGNQQILKFNWVRIKNIRHLANLVDSCQDKYLVFEFEENFLAILEREIYATASSCILKDYGVPSERSSDLLESHVDLSEDSQATVDYIGDSLVSNLEISFDGLIWA